MKPSWWTRFFLHLLQGHRWYRFFSSGVGPLYFLCSHLINSTNPPHRITTPPPTKTMQRMAATSRMAPAAPATSIARPHPDKSTTKGGNIADMVFIVFSLELRGSNPVRSHVRMFLWYVKWLCLSRQRSHCHAMVAPPCDGTSGQTSQKSQFSGLFDRMIFKRTDCKIYQILGILSSPSEIGRIEGLWQRNTTSKK